MELMNFDEVIKKIEKTKGKRSWNLLMGNGFSISYSPTMFSYNVLHDFVKSKDDEVLSILFDCIKTSNFELIMKQLDTTLSLAQNFDADDEFISKLVDANEKLKKSLITAIQTLHPDHVFRIEENESKTCSEFISMFLETKGEIFTTNYDLLMYWVLMRNQIKDICDGFSREVEFDEENFDERQEGDLIWGWNKENQNIHYLHGTLPFFDSGISIIKEEYDGNYLLDKIKMRIKNDEYPIFVTSGSGRDKLEQIKHNAYLAFCYDRLSRVTGSIVSYGFNFGKYDEHIIAAINKATKFNGKGKLLSIYIGVYSEDDKEYIESIKDKFKCKVSIFDSKTAHIWG